MPSQVNEAGQVASMFSSHCISSCIGAGRSTQLAALLGVVGVGVLAARFLKSAEEDTVEDEVYTSPYMGEPQTAGLLDVNENSPMKLRMEDMVMRAQAKICRGVQKMDGKAKFKVDKWARKEGGGGVTCILSEGAVWEKAGVAVSAVYGTLSAGAAATMRERGKTLEEGDQFFATGISLVMHPSNPSAPTVHCNYRYFEIINEKDPSKPVHWWFGGGADLTPSYLFEEDAIHFHKVHQEACEKHDSTFYPRFKKWCDEYFYLPHRDECRGIGGIFYDDLDEKDPEKLFAFASECADAFNTAYLPIIAKRKNMKFTEEMKRWQQIRRGRYAEFNLAIDRGTKFGLFTPGSRTESILMSL
eukprot:Ihof_evm1s649 gene=Ihof_evmTU1s649